MTSFLPVEERIVLVMPDDLPFNASLLGHNDTNSSSGNSTEEIIDYSWSFEFSVILASILSVAAFCIIVGNCMVLMVIVRHRGMRTRTNLFLVNLAVADLFVGLFVVPFTITTLVENKWIFGDGIVCKFNGWMNSFCLISSIHTLMYISIHKYYSIVRPLSNPLKLSYIIGMMAAAWVWAGVCSTMNIMGLKVEYKPGTSQCGPRYPDDVQSFIIHGILQVTVILIPLIILVFCYTRMFQEIKKHSDRLRTNSTVAEDLILTQQKKVAVTLLIVLATFVIMALPYHAYANYTTIIKDKKHFSSYLNPIAYTFLFISSMCNPIIYAFRSPAFREGYKEILCQTPNYVISDGPMGTIRCVTRKHNGYFTSMYSNSLTSVGRDLTDRRLKFKSASADQLYIRHVNKLRLANGAPDRRISASADQLRRVDHKELSTFNGHPANLVYPYAAGQHSSSDLSDERL